MGAADVCAVRVQCWVRCWACSSGGEHTALPASAAARDISPPSCAPPGPHHASSLRMSPANVHTLLYAC
eukprot:367153-Prymnesium_polylepis.1